VDLEVDAVALAVPGVQVTVVAPVAGGDEEGAIDQTDLAGDLALQL